MSGMHVHYTIILLYRIDNNNITGTLLCLIKGNEHKMIIMYYHCYCSDFK